MGEWNPEKYLLFKKQRTQPAIDLANRIRDFSPESALDLGCGPGNSTEVLHTVFPNSEILGIDSSKAMIENAKLQHKNLNFELGDARNITGSYDLIFSNACLQWVPNHETLIPYLVSKLNEGGMLAVQMPINHNEPLFRIIDETVEEFKNCFENAVIESNDVLSPERYNDILFGCSRYFEIWETVYYHIMTSHEHLLEWVRSTRLRPYLEVLNDDKKCEFENAILSKAKRVYKPTACGEIIFRFKRLFFTAVK